MSYRRGCSSKSGNPYWVDGVVRLERGCGLDAGLDARRTLLRGPCRGKKGWGWGWTLPWAWCCLTPWGHTIHLKPTKCDYGAKEKGRDNSKVVFTIASPIIEWMASFEKVCCVWVLSTNLCPEEGPAVLWRFGGLQPCSRCPSFTVTMNKVLICTLTFDLCK